MKKDEREILDFLEGRLGDDARHRVEASLASNPEHKRAVDEYQILLETEKALAQREHSLTPAFTVSVMEQIENEVHLSSLSRFTLALYTSRWSLPTYLATVSALLIVIFQSLSYSPLLPFSGNRELAMIKGSVEVLLPAADIDAGSQLESSLLKVRSLPLRDLAPGTLFAAEASFVTGKRAISSLSADTPLRRDQINWSTPSPVAETRSEERENLRAVTVEADLNALPLQVLTPGRYVEVQLRVNKRSDHQTLSDTTSEPQTLSRFSQVVRVTTLPGSPPRTTLQLLLAPAEEELLNFAQNLPLSLALVDRHGEATSLIALNEILQEDDGGSLAEGSEGIRTVSLRERSEKESESLSSDCTLSIREHSRKSGDPLVRKLCVSARAATDLKPGTTLTYDLLMLRIKTVTTSIDLPTTASDRAKLSHLVGRSTTEFIPKGDLVTEENTR